MSTIDRLQAVYDAELAADPEKQRKHDEAEAKLRPLFLKLGAHHDSIFPPIHPDALKRGTRGSKADRDLVGMVALLLDIKMKIPGDDSAVRMAKMVSVAIQKQDPAFFHMAARACEYLKGIPQTKFPRHVIACRQSAAELMVGGKAPTAEAVIKRAIKRLGDGAYDIGESSRWSPIMKMAGLADLERKRSQKRQGDRYTAPS